MEKIKLNFGTNSSVSDEELRDCISDEDFEIHDLTPETKNRRTTIKLVHQKITNNMRIFTEEINISKKKTKKDQIFIRYRNFYNSRKERRQSMSVLLRSSRDIRGLNANSPVKSSKSFTSFSSSTSQDSLTKLDSSKLSTIDAYKRKLAKNKVFKTVNRTHKVWDFMQTWIIFLLTV